ncbi:acyltransferase [Proteus faecis]|uniref:acyltransferase n=1 Tax=Proteus faecis TaxID=2050967 RepID=UPI0021BA8208|nr:acyltransferase [Proteus faecis]MCT8249416.1 acyltransferase [Proteus faecis]
MNILKKIINIIEKKFFYYKYLKKIGVKFGNNCLINKQTNFGSEPYLINIGNNFYCSSNIQFVTHDGSINVIRNLYPEFKKHDLISPINIGDNVFLGINVIVLPGTNIEDNIIVGAGSIVKGHLISGHVYAGIPAKKICTLNEFKEKNKSVFIETKNLSYQRKKKFLLKHFKNINSSRKRK